MKAGPLYHYRKQAAWQKHRARILLFDERSLEVALSPYSRLKHYYPEVAYEYFSDGRRYLGHRVSFERESIWVPEFNQWGNPVAYTERWWLAVKPGDEMTVHIKPENPADAVLFNRPGRTRRSHYLALLTGGILMALFWLLLSSV